MKLQKYWISFVTISLVCSFSVGCVNNNAVDGSVITTKMMEHQKEIKDISYSRLLTVYIGNQSRTAQSDIWIKMPDKEKMVEMDNLSLKNTVITNGTVMSVYNPIKNSAIVINHPSADIIPDSMKFQTFVQDLINNNTVEFQGSDLINNVTTLKFVPKLQHGPDSYYSILWLDSNTYMPLKVQMYSNGQLVMTVEYINYKINSGMSDSEFEYLLPENASILVK